MGIFAHIDEYGFIQTPYRKVEKGKVTGDVIHLRADEEIRSTLVPAEALDASGKIEGASVLARHQGELMQMHPNEVNYVDVSPKQIVGVSAAMIPFLEHDDANRALMGANMQRQAVPLLKPEVPWVATGMEKSAGVHSGMAVRASNSGKVTFVDAERIVVDNSDEYELLKFRGLNERTCNTQKPIVKLGQSVKKGQIIADGASTVQGELGLGKNILVAFNTFDGYNFEDAIVISEQLVKDDTFTSIHIEDFDVEIRETKLGREEFTRDIPNVSEKALSNLDENGIVRVGARVGLGDILVGKVSPKSKSELTPEEKLLHAIFGRAGEDVKNDSLTVPSGTQGIVIGTRKFSRRLHLTDEQKVALAEEQEAYEEMMDEKAIKLFREMVESVNEITGTQMVDPMTRQKVGQSDIPEVVLEQIENFSEKWIKGGKEVRDDALKTYSQFWPRIQAIDEEKQRRIQHMKRGDELGNGVLEMVKVYIAAKRPLSVGDKMAGRHGNKGVIARIVPEEDMPFLEDGTPVQILLNPLGVPSRMNVGQVLELHMGWAAAVLGFQCCTPVFDGASEAEVLAAIDEANAHVQDKVGSFEKGEGDAGTSRELLAQMPFRGKVQLYDGRTGKRSSNATRWVTCTSSNCTTWWTTRSTLVRRVPIPSSPSSRSVAKPGPVVSAWRDGSLGARRLRARVHPARTPHRQVRRCGRSHEDLRLHGQGRQHARSRHAGGLRCAHERDQGSRHEHPNSEGRGRATAGLVTSTLIFAPVPRSSLFVPLLRAPQCPKPSTTASTTSLASRSILLPPTTSVRGPLVKSRSLRPSTIAPTVPRKTVCSANAFWS